MVGDVFVEMMLLYNAPRATNINVDIELVALFVFGFIRIINGEIQNDFN